MTSSGILQVPFQIFRRMFEQGDTVFAQSFGKGPYVEAS